MPKNMQWNILKLDIDKLDIDKLVNQDKMEGPSVQNFISSCRHFKKGKSADASTRIESKLILLDLWWFMHVAIDIYIDIL